MIGDRFYLAFSPDMAYKVLTGRKICTTRRERHGRIGDYFELHGAKYEILDIWTIRLKDVKRWFFACEGFSCPDAFERKWRDLHDGRFDEHRLHYVHWFGRLTERSE